jgi:hypothetical protein
MPADSIVPDAKDWTWVLERPCPECGLDTRDIAREQVAGLVRDVTVSWRDVLTGPPGDVSARPAPQVWSPLEYGCHVRDVLRLYDERLHLMLRQDDPLFPNWDQDATAVEEGYAYQDPMTVAGELVVAGEQIAASFDAVAGDEWHRTGARSDGVRFTVETFARYFMHDPIHHLYDVTGVRSVRP